MVKWQKEAASTQLPLVDFQSSKKYVIVRENESSAIKTDEEGNESVEYSYDMAFMTNNEYLQYTKTLPLTQVNGKNSNGTYLINGETITVNNAIDIKEEKNTWTYPCKLNEAFSLSIHSSDGKKVNVTSWDNESVKFEATIGTVVTVSVVGK